MKRPTASAARGGVYWLESSKRRQALDWLRRADLTGAERRALEAFAERYRTEPGLSAAERRRLLAAFDRVGKRLRGGSPGEPDA